MFPNLALNRCLVLQVIIKKFHILCPLPEEAAINETFSKVLNMTLSQLNNTTMDYSEDACTPKYFVFNSQVRLYERQASLPKVCVMFTASFGIRCLVL